MAKKISASKVITSLEKANREELVIDAYEQMLGTSDGRPFACDGLYGGVLTEFKLNVALDGAAGIRVMAQAICYLRKFIYDGVYKGERFLAPTHIAICDQDQAMVIPASKVEHLAHCDFDWTRPASSPDPKLIDAVNAEVSDQIVFDMTTESGIEAFSAAISSDEDTILQVITRHNFDSIFDVWKQNFAPQKDPQEAALAFILDLQLQGIADHEAGRIVLRCEEAVGKNTKYFDIRVPIGAYESFWNTYKRPPTNEEMAAIIERKDRLVVMHSRRITGEFFTPLEYAALAHEYLAEAIPDRYEGEGTHHSMYDDYNWWDPCCGTGNLTLDCPPNMKGELFLSTLQQEDIDVIKNSGQNPNATIFQYDFLNSVDHELPENLQAALENGKPWIFILNPPFSGGTGGQFIEDGKVKRIKMSDTLTANRMREAKMGHATQNPMGQFIFKIQKMTMRYDMDVHIGMFSKVTLWTGIGLKKFRDFFYGWFQSINGFCFHCSDFQGTSGNWPVVYTVWGTNHPNSKVTVNILKSPNVIIGEKLFTAPDDPLNKWTKRPKATIIRPPMISAIGFSDNPRMDRQSKDAIATIYSHGNDVMHCQRSVYITSGPNYQGCGWSITPDNFHKSIICFLARKLVIPTWLNDKDEFSVPDTNHPNYDQFALDGVVFSLFHGSNQTSSLGNIEYQGKTYDIPNNFFWMTPEEMMGIEGLPRPIWQQCRTAQPKFVCEWLNDHREEFSDNALQIIEMGKDLVRESASHRPNALPKYQLDRWDAGWYQIRMGLYGKDVPFEQPQEMMELIDDFKDVHTALGDRLRPMIYELGFLPEEKLVENENTI